MSDDTTNKARQKNTKYSVGAGFPVGKNFPQPKGNELHKKEGITRRD